MAGSLLRPGNVKRIPWPVVVATLGLNVLGLYALGSSTGVDLTSFSSFLSSLPVRQGVYSLLGIGILITTTFIDYTIFRRWAGLIYLLTLSLLLYVLVSGIAQNASRRWISLGPINVQPSEIAKISLIMILSRYLMFKDHLRSVWKLLYSLLLLLLPVVLIVLEPDLGTALLLGPIYLSLVFVAGIPKKYLFIGFLLVLLSLPVGYFSLLKDYQKERIKGFLTPHEAPLEEGYHLIQSKTAIGRGGLTGRYSTRLPNDASTYVPLKHNDFIFSVIGEKLGFLGSCTVLLLYGVLIFSCFRFAATLQEPFGCHVCIGIGTLFCIQSFVNLGMTVGLLPITGLPLPFLSYGGSSLVTSYFAVGLVLSIRAAELPSFSEKDENTPSEPIRKVGFDHSLQS